LTVAARRQDPGSRKPKGKGKGKAASARTGRRPAKRAIDVTPLPAGDAAADGRVRLNRFLASAGVCSRRTADEHIAAGRVSVNGEVVTELGARIDPATDEVRHDGRTVEPERPVWVLFNKPKGVVCTNAPGEQRPRVIDYLPDVRGRVYTVGRLDLDSEGLVLVTNDGALAQRIAHPRYGVPKTYAVLLRGRIRREDVDKARGGVWLSDGPTAGARITVERLGRDRSYLKVTIREGRNREIRRVFAKLGYPVQSLKRVRIGPLSLHGLGSGKHRFLSRAEVAALTELARGEGHA